MILLKSPQEIAIMRDANRIVAEILAELANRVKPGVSTWELNEYSETLARKYRVRPAFKGYRGFPYALCTSINEEVVHGMPSRERLLREGDIISLDFGVIYRGYYGDAAITVAVGQVDKEAERLLRTTEQSLYKGIAQAVVGNRLSDISHAIQSYVEERGFSVVREFVGHGIGRSLHESPQIPNYGSPGLGVRLKAGMVLAIEPMINQGDSGVEILEDGWTAVTKDRRLSAHYEHSIAITDNGPEILSRR
ncbi:MAG: type I methionyl aminopeptidase [Deltaproteobacteria bacterium]|nr:type I methionyl aminopeptidase [Deltaproteobacteria bacterium]MBW2070340.1 type I methionyl aminopeptidase [Deltaproteobacteria bacterium]